jgi:DedD protein
MTWPFSRSELKSPDEGPAGSGDRKAEAGDPASELRVQARRRLIGAAALLLAAVIVLPIVLDSAPRPVPEDLAITVATPPPPPVARKPAEPPPAIDEKIAEPAPVRSEPAPVEAPSTAAKPAPIAQPAPAEPASSPASSTERIVVQVAALSTPAAADDLRARLILGGFSAYVDTVAVADGTLHRVRVGPFARRDEALRAVEKLKAAGHKAKLVSG